MIYLTVALCFTVAALAALLFWVMRAARDERRDLENRVMALSKPEALITHHALDEPQAAEVAYMDETAEYALGNGDVDLLGDD